MKILVIDDFAGNIASAKVNMAGHEVTTIDSIQKAHDLLKGGEQFDAVLTDLFMPIGEFRGCMRGNYISWDDRKKEIPAGLVFAIKAANKGIRTVICTDANHHTDWICSLLDLVGDVTIRSGKGDINQTICYVEARHASVRGYWDEEKCEIVPAEYAPDGKRSVKDWLQAMQKSGLFPELSKPKA